GDAGCQEVRRFTRLPREGGLDRMIANMDGGVHERVAAAIGRLSWPGRELLSAEALDRALDATRRWLLAAQHPDGYWVGELEGDTILESEYILLMAYLGREHEAVCVKAGRYI